MAQRLKTSLPVQGAWSQVVFQEISASAHRSCVGAHFLFTSAELKSSEAPKKMAPNCQPIGGRLRPERLPGSRRTLARLWVQARIGRACRSAPARQNIKRASYGFWQTRPMSACPPCWPIFAEGALKKIPMLGGGFAESGQRLVLNVLAELPGLRAHIPTQPVGTAREVRHRAASDRRGAEQSRRRKPASAGKQIEEMSTPDCGLGPDGHSHRTLRKLLPRVFLIAETNFRGFGVGR